MGERIKQYRIISNWNLADQVYEMELEGDSSWITHPGQFLNVTIDNAYLKRPISICDWNENGLTIIYKVVGFGTKQMSQKQPGERLECLVGLGNGFTPEVFDEKKVLLVGGGVGVPPLYGLAKTCLKQGKQPVVILGFTSEKDIFYIKKFADLGCDFKLSTNDGSQGVKGFVSDVMVQEGLTNLPYFACGPMPMLKAVWRTSNAPGQLSFEERMGCGFGACMGCSCETISGPKRICKEGPVLSSQEVLWTKD